MSKHTPGPWKVAKPRKSYRDGNMMYGIVGPECVIDYEDWGFTRANARLIAAAPDLLEALVELSKSFIGTYTNDTRSDDEIDDHRLLWENKAIELIARATGDTK